CFLLPCMNANDMHALVMRQYAKPGDRYSASKTSPGGVRQNQPLLRVSSAPIPVVPVAGYTLPRDQERAISQPHYAHSDPRESLMPRRAEHGPEPASDDWRRFQQSLLYMGVVRSAQAREGYHGQAQRSLVTPVPPAHTPSICFVSLDP